MNETAKLYMMMVVNPTVGGMIRCLNDAGYRWKDVVDYMDDRGLRYFGL